MIETEDTIAKHMYLILKGEVKLMKKPENLYDKDGKLLKLSSQLDLVKDPKNQGTEKLGI